MAKEIPVIPVTPDPMEGFTVMISPNYCDGRGQILRHGGECKVASHLVSSMLLKGYRLNK